jgi:guanosine-3',5'-bis(diphosphate) 3'-pyrophosphohydrolase
MPPLVRKRSRNVKAGNGPVHPWQAAAAFAARAHQHQLRKDQRTPYVSHVFRVATTVMLVFGCHDETAITAAILHDTIEDTATDYDDIAENFGDTVAHLVAALTKNMLLPEDAREKDYDRRLAAADWRARLIKLGDTYDNFIDKAELSPKKRRALIDKCRRAIALARPDARARPEVRRAIAAVEGLLKSSKT